MLREIMYETYVLITEHQTFIAETRHWLETIVIGLNLCPFARGELVSERVQFTVSDAHTREQLLMDLYTSLLALADNPAIETTLLIHPHVLQNFDDYNQFLDIADALLCDMDMEGVYQIASFHPDYQFADTALEDARNYSNKSPYPMLHLLSEESLEKAIDNNADTALIPERNKALLNKMGIKKLKEILGKT
ncbi:MAG: hypothetical protein ACI934_000734 [Pseudohongiellaceae bacterium]|jgi:hypothetical protein